MLENHLDYYCRTSCKTYEGIEDMFYNLIDRYLEKNKYVLKTKNKKVNDVLKIKNRMVKLEKYLKF